MRSINRTPKAICIAALFYFVALSSLAFASDEESMDDILGGFDDSDFADFTEDAEDDSDAPDDVEESESAPERIWRVQGDVDFGLAASLVDHESATGTDYSGVQRVRTRLALQFDLDLPRKWKFRTSGWGFYDFAYLLNGRSQYTKAVLGTHEAEIQLTDTYLEGRLHEHVDLKIGRQVVNWGRSDSLRILDIINPLNNRDPGLADIQDIRRPLGMAKLGLFYGPWTLTLLAIPEIRFDILPAVGSDQAPDITGLVPSSAAEFALLRASLSPPKQAIFDQLFVNGGTDLLRPQEEIPNDFGTATEFAGNLTGVFSGWDVSFQAAIYNDDLPHFNLARRQLEHARLWMVGGGANYTIGPWLFKGEIAYIDGLEFLWANDSKSRIDSMLGVEYYGFSDVNIALEVAQRHINGFEKSMELPFDFAQEDSLEFAIRVSKSLLNDRASLNLFGFVLGGRGQGGSFVRLSADYDVIDALTLETGILLFQSGNTLFFSGTGKSDRFYFGAKYSF